MPCITHPKQEIQYKKDERGSSSQGISLSLPKLFWRRRTRQKHRAAYWVSVINERPNGSCCCYSCCCCVCPIWFIRWSDSIRPFFFPSNIGKRGSRAFRVGISFYIHPIRQGPGARAPARRAEQQQQHSQTATTTTTHCPFLLSFLLDDLNYS